MPFTPFHFGVGYAAVAAEKKPALFALYVFVITQVVIDLETLVNILNHAPRLHTFFHTFTGSLIPTVISVGIGWMVFPLGAWFVGLLPNRVAEWVYLWRFFPREMPGFSCLVQSAFFGAWSHIVLDAVMHADVTPFAPYTNWNPFLEAVDVATLHYLCLGSFVAGIIWMRGRRQKDASL